MVNMVKNFVKLFMIDEGAVETITNDEWSKKIDRAIQKKIREEMRNPALK